MKALFPIAKNVEQNETEKMLCSFITDYISGYIDFVSLPTLYMYQCGCIKYVAF